MVVTREPPPEEPRAPSPGPARPAVTPDALAAHRWARRRTESALVRADATPATDPLRTRARATLVGALVALLGLAAAAVVGLVDRPADWRGAAVVVAAESGALAVVAHGPDRLVPVTDLASARLVAAALAEADGAAAPDPTAPPVEVDGNVLAAAPRARPVGIVGAPAPPSTGATVPRTWSVCDGRTGGARTSTTVRVAADPPGRPLDPGRALLLRDPSGTTWLVHDRIRSRVETADAAVVAALGLAGRTPRPVTAGLLEALPPGPALAAPVLPGRGAPGPPGLAGEPVGGVVRLVGVAAPDRFLVVETGGVQEVPPLVAALVRLSDPVRRGVPVPAVPPGAVAALPGARDIRTEDYPPRAPTPVDGAGAVCVGRAADTAAATVTLAPDPAAGAVAVPAALPAPGSGPDGRADAVALPATGMVVRPVPPGRPELGGPTLLVGPTGRASRIADPGTAAALGLPAPTPVPAAVLALLPPGPELSVDAALRPVGP